MEQRAAAEEEEQLSDSDLDQGLEIKGGAGAWRLTLQVLPPGFRFQPTEEELVGFYLHRKAAGLKLPSQVIADIDLYKHNPWELPGLSPLASASQWFFFNFSDKKYPKGSRTNRATSAGYWKATGRDKSISTHPYSAASSPLPAHQYCMSAIDIMSAQPQPLCGIKKTLVFYHGRAPHGTRTPWVMHEFHLSSLPSCSPPYTDNIVLCRIVKKNMPHPSNLQGEVDGSE